MGIFILLGLAFLFQLAFPQMASVLAWLLTIGFIIPFFTFAGGTLAWALINIFTAGAFFSGSAWLGCCAFIGLPVGLFMAWFVLAD